MWQVDFYVAVERERERLRELEQRRRLADAAGQVARVGSDGSPLQRGAARVLTSGRGLVASFAGALDRLAVGPHHS